jgi:hypothetical protein
MEHDHPVLAGLGIVSLVLIILAILIVPTIFYLITLQKALGRCSPASRAMNPAMVWLLLIPLFNLVWQFFVVLNVAKSLGAEFQRRGIPEEPEPGQTMGLIMCVSKLLCGPVWLVFWIIYWVKVAGFSSKLSTPPAQA